LAAAHPGGGPRASIETRGRRDLRCSRPGFDPSAPHGYISQVMNHLTGRGAGAAAGRGDAAVRADRRATGRRHRRLRTGQGRAGGGVRGGGGGVAATNELAAFYHMNPATAAKGINLLVDEAVLEKRRGIGMFVAAGAREQLRTGRRKQFAEQYLDPMLAEAKR